MTQLKPDSYRLVAASCFNCGWSGAAPAGEKSECPKCGHLVRIAPMPKIENRGNLR